jgi:hypothetical protein
VFLRRPWSLVGLLVVLSACSLLPAAAPDPAATEAAIQSAVAGTATALAASLPAASPATAAQPAPTAMPSATPARPPSPAALVVPATATPAGTPSAASPPASPRPPGTRMPLTSEEAAYLRSLRPFLREFNQSFERFAELVSDPQPEDATWRVALSAELRLWADGAEAARGVRPPESMAPVHRQVVTGLELYRQASQQITQALQAGDEDGVRRGLEMVRQARRAFFDAERELERLAQERGL